LEFISKSDGPSAIVRRICEIILNPGDKDEEKERAGIEWRLFTAYILRNFTQSHDVRRILASESLTDSKEGASTPILTSLLAILMRSNEVLKRAVSGVVRNCCFDTGLHQTLISMGNDDLLSALLFPLIGGEQLSDEENDALPIDLQYMDTTKQRESDSNIRINILEALYQLCATSQIREYIRKKGTYYVLREYHKWEQQNASKGDQDASKADVLCANVIGMLIRTEDEIDCDNLKTLETTSD